MTVWTEQLDDLLADPNQSASIVYVPAGGNPAEALALVERPDVEALLGGQLVEQSVLTFTVRLADLPVQPRRGDLVAWASRDWFVSEPGWTDEDGYAWTFRAARTG